MTDPKIMQITSLGAQGDGIAINSTNERAFISGALPGESWAIGSQEPHLSGAPAPTRQTPPCSHFDVCGGCVAQHMNDATYRDWKRNLIVDALARENIEADIEELWSASPRSRRRGTLEMKRDGGTCTIGFHARKGHDVFDMTECHVLAQEIVAAMPSLRSIGKLILPEQGTAQVAVTKTDTGLAISIEAKRLQKLAAEVQGKLAQHCKAIACVRLIINGEIFVSREAPTLAFGSSSITIPESSFLQAVPEAEHAMQDRVCVALAKCKSIADIFCGVGTFALPLAKKSRVAGYDNDVAALEALNIAARHSQGLKPLTTSRRDLFRQPLGVREFKGIDGVIINPPRAGAQNQCTQLAASTVKTIVMVSCNPTTFARDARILIDGAYTIGSVAPINQFLWSPHLEVVATFTNR